MRLLLLLLALMLAACAPDEPSSDLGISRSCIRSFAPTLDAWEAEFGRVPDACAYLDDAYEVQLVSGDEMPCDEPVGVNEVRTECVHDGVLYVNEALDDIQQTDASVHGWVHALAECVDGDIDHDHLRAQLWSVYGADTIEIQAQASAEIGSCL